MAIGTMASATDGESVFNFFGLPQELRNEIYKCATVDEVDIKKKVAKMPTSVRLLMNDAALAKLLTLNRQFKSKYEQSVNDVRTLVIKDPGSGFRPLYLRNKTFPVFQRLEVHFQITVRRCSSRKTCRQALDVGEARRVTRSLLAQLERVQELSVKLLVVLNDDEGSQRPLVPCSRMKSELDKFTKIPRLIRLEVQPLRSGYWPDDGILATCLADDVWKE